MLTLAVVAQAQQTSVGKARVSAIRQAYAEAKKKVANSDELAKQGKPSNRLVANSSYTLGKEAGQVTTTDYFTEEEDTLLGRFFYEPYLSGNNTSTLTQRNTGTFQFGAELSLNL